jgi:SAM-dependent methyltransferase
MENYGASTYGDRFADDYDRWYPEVDPEMVETLAGLAGGGPALELAIGTGRVAIPLTERGVEVHGVDISASMVERLRAKAGGAAIPVTMGDIADVPVDGRFRLVYLVFNTLFALLTPEEQLRCFRNVGARLDAESRFVIEAFVPDLARFDRGQRVSAISVGVDSARLDVSQHHPATQRVDVQHVELGPFGIKLFPVAIRYAWPSELDLMAALAGLELESRWGGWDRSEFGDESVRHVSVYRPA